MVCGMRALAHDLRVAMQPSRVLLVGLAEELHHLLLRRLVRVREAAGVLHRVLSQDVEVLGLGPQRLDVWRDVEPLVQALDGVQHRLHGLVLVLADLGEAHGMCDVDEELRHVLGIVRLHNGEKHRIADAMGCVVEAPELVSHGVHVAQAGGVEGHAREELRVGHHVPGLHVFAVLHCLRQVGGDELHGVERVGVRDGVGRRAQVGLDGVRQRVHAGGRREALGHPNHEQWVVHRQRGSEAPVHEGHLHLPRVVGDDAEARHLRRCARRGVHRHHGQHGHGALVHALVVLDLPTVGGQHADGLGAVVRGAAAKGDDEVAVVFLEQLAAGIDLLYRGVWGAAVEDGVGHFGTVEHVREGLHRANLHKDRVGDDEGVCFAEVSHLIDCAHQSTLAEQGLGGHVEGAALLAGRWVVIVNAMGALRGVTGEVTLDLVS
mmetsp:Transcript_60256/g.161374  ORF Transcript_60256/g.161374 Transcript_60256/m.161374 type:complete len:434 (-) Transcript_60256:174-1475(-)